MQSERSLPELTRELAAHVGDLMRNEVRLARAETVESLKDMGDAVLRAALGVALAGAAVCLALFALAFALAQIMPQWAAALLSAGIGGALAYLLIKHGLKAISVDRIDLPRTKKQVSRDLRLITKDANP